MYSDKQEDGKENIYYYWNYYYWKNEKEVESEYL